MKNSPDFSTGEKRSENRDAVNAAIEAITVTKPSAEWIEQLAGIGVPCGPIYSIDQMFDDPQVRHLAMEHPVDHPVLGPMNLVGQAFRLSRYQPKTGMPTPDRGQHTEEVLTEFGFEPSEIDNLKTRGVL